MKQIPPYHELMIPTIQVIDELGGSGTNQEIAEGVIQFLGLAEEITSQPHNPEKSSQTEVEYRLAWARTYLKKVGLIDNSKLPGVSTVSWPYERRLYKHTTHQNSNQSWHDERTHKSYRVSS